MAAAVGARLLDRKYPGWHDQIDTGTISNRNPGLSLLKQLYSNLLEGLDNLFRGEKALRKYGFVADCPFELKQEWLDEIFARRTKIDVERN